MISEFFAGWNRFWFRDVPPHALALFRIGFGIFLLLYWGLQWPTVTLRYSTAGVVIPYIMDQEIFFVPPEVALATFGFFYACLILVTIGWATRPAALLAFCCYLYYWLLSLYIFDTSFDRLFMLVLLLLAFSGCDRTFSYSMRRRRDSWWAWQETSVFPQRLLTLQIAAIYLAVGLQKTILPDWRDGHIVYQSFVGRWGTGLSRAIAAMDLPPWMYDITAKATAFLEVGLSVGLWIRRLRWFFIIAGLLFHIAVAVFMGVWWFLAMPIAYILFFPPEEVYLFLKGHSKGKIM